MSRRAFAALLACLSLVWSTLPAGASVAAPAAGGRAQPAFDQAASPALPQVTLLDPGAEPRQLLRYHLAAGQVDTLELEMTMGVTTAFGPQEVAMDSPAMRVVASATVSGVSPEGVADFDLVFTSAELVDPDASGDVADAMRDSLGELVGVSMHARMDDRGRILGSSVETPTTLDPTAQQTMQGLVDSMDQIVSPLPEEPVGTGARWEVITTVPAGTVAAQMTSTFTLVAAEGERVELGFDVTQTAEPQAMTSDLMPEGTTMTLESLEGQGGGTTRIDLGGLASELTSSAEVRMRYTVTMGEESMEMGMTMTTEMTMRPTG